MRKILEVIKFLVDCAGAIHKGFEVTTDAWPTDNPFKKNEPSA